MYTHKKSDDIFIINIDNHQEIVAALAAFCEEQNVHCGVIEGKNASKIRIDVVDDYENNVIPFWEKMGFIRTKKEELTWGGKTSSVTVMEKSIS